MKKHIYGRQIATDIRSGWMQNLVDNFISIDNTFEKFVTLQINVV